MANSVYAAAKTAVFWDMEDCPIPNGLNADLISKNIKSALENAGYHGRVASVTAYVDEPNQIQKDDLESVGIKLGHVPGGGKGKGRARKQAIRCHMWGWAVENPESNLVVISEYVSDKTLYALRTRGYNILLAHPENAAGQQVIDDATLVWFWTSLAAGGKPIDKPATCGGCLTFQGI